MITSLLLWLLLLMLFYAAYVMGARNAAMRLAGQRSIPPVIPTAEMADAEAKLAPLMMVTGRKFAGGALQFEGRLRGKADDMFKRLRDAFADESVTPLLLEGEADEVRVMVVPKTLAVPAAKRPNWTAHWLLFFATMVTTTWAGALNAGVNLLQQPERFAVGLPYSLGLLVILGAHELGHYFTAKAHGIQVTPPYFIPVPFALGTFGAFIRIRSMTPNRRTLFDVAVAGPLAGLVWRWGTRCLAWGAALCGAGAAVDLYEHNDLRQFGYSWLLAFMFWLSLVLGSLFLVMVHHLCDASWSVPIRRFCEHLSCLICPWMILFFLPVAVLAPEIYSWMRVPPGADRLLRAKWPLLTTAGFYGLSAGCLAVWWLLGWRLRHWSLKQDLSGASACTYRLRRYACAGLVAFALTLTLGAILWMNTLQFQWYSTMYGVYFFAGCAWTALAAAYAIAAMLSRAGLLHGTMRPQQFYLLGSLLFAFTVFSAYIHFSQYFVIWNANMPEETFWYVLREKGSWFGVGLVLVFGHFLLPFLALLRIDVKRIVPFMVPLCLWIGLMQYVDLAFNITPALHPSGFPFRWMWLDAGCIAFMGGILARAFLRDLQRHPTIPVKDPRLMEAVGLYVIPVPEPVTTPSASPPRPLTPLE